jgi:hypothetical protein
MPQPGEIYCYKNYQFENGSRSDKLFVILNRVDSNTPCLVLKTTSQSKRYTGVRRGCNSQKKVFFVPTDWERCFNADTYIQLPQIIEFSIVELLQGGFSDRIYRVNSLSSNCFAQLRNCLKQFKEDLSERQRKLIFKS